jgi:hypothetical protein
MFKGKKLCWVVIRENMILVTGLSFAGETCISGQCYVKVCIYVAVCKVITGILLVNCFTHLPGVFL